MPLCAGPLDSQSLRFHFGALHLQIPLECRWNSKQTQCLIGHEGYSNEARDEFLGPGKGVYSAGARFRAELELESRSQPRTVVAGTLSYADIGQSRSSGFGE